MLLPSTSPYGKWFGCVAKSRTCGVLGSPNTCTEDVCDPLRYPRDLGYKKYSGFKVLLRLFLGLSEKFVNGLVGLKLTITKPVVNLFLGFIDRS